MSVPRSDDTPRLLLVVLSLSAGGTERVISEMANWWAQHGREVAVLTLWGRETDHYALDPRVRRFVLDFWRRSHTPGKFITSRIRLLACIRQTVLKFRPHAVISFIDLINIIMAVVLTGTGIPLIISERIDPRHHRIGKFRALARRICYPLAQALVVQTREVTPWARSMVPSRKVKVIPNFVRQFPAAQPVERRSLILAMGRLCHQKGHDLLLRGFAAAGAAEAGWRLVILGEGPDRPALEALALELGIDHALTLPGIVDEPQTWLHQACIFAHPSRYEGFPNALLEAMACGCAVIATDCPSGPAEIIRHGENGLLIPTKDEAALTRALLSLINNEALRLRLGHQALEVRSRFARATIMARWDALVDDVRNKGERF